MKNIKLIILFFFLLFNNFYFSYSAASIQNQIVVKVGDTIITSIDIQNQILTNLMINKQEITEDNVNKNKQYSLKMLIDMSIKKGEIDKYKITEYNKNDLREYLNSVAKNFNTDVKGLKQIFEESNISYNSFVKKHEIELLWNTLIFTIYRNQININMVDVENEVKKIQGNKKKEELIKIKNTILNKKKEDKLNLFSRSHFTNLQNKISVNFQ